MKRMMSGAIFARRPDDVRIENLSGHVSVQRGGPEPRVRGLGDRRNFGTGRRKGRHQRGRESNEGSDA